jgi:hypothetical protein
MDRAVDEALAEFREAHVEHQAATLRLTKAMERVLALGRSPVEVASELQQPDVCLSFASKPNSAKPKQRGRLTTAELLAVQKAVIAAVQGMSRRGGGVKVGHIAAEVGVSTKVAGRVCRGLLGQGELVRVAYGYYKVV